MPAHIVPPLVQLAISSFVLGVAAHMGYFIHGEHHIQAWTYIQLLYLIPTISLVLVSRLGGFAWLEAAAIVYSAWPSFIVGIFASMTVYRLFLHPLRKFPGPPALRLTKWWHILQLGHLQNYRTLDEWHEQYGDFVRIGPGEIAVRHPDAVEKIMSARSKCDKGPWYDISLPLVSLHTLRDRQMHDKRRRVWDKGFSIKALESYESRVKKYALDLVGRIDEAKGVAMDVSRWFNYYSFDVMGELAFGRSFDMLHSGKEHYAISYLHEGTKPVGQFSHMPWLMMVFARIPGLSKAFHQWLGWCLKQAQDRKKMDMREKDIMSYLLSADSMSDDPAVETNWLMGDSRLVIVAGSDTTASALAHLFHHLASNPAVVSKLRAEVQKLHDAQDPYSPFEMRDLADKAPYLNACINDTLRLHPAVPSGLPRTTPPEGITVGDTFIPGDMNIVVPMWTQGRDERCFADADKFVPERWLDGEGELLKEATGYAPFGLGRYGCIGKQLALMEVRFVTACLVQRYDIAFAGKDVELKGSRLIDGSVDYFTMGLGSLELSLKKRG